VLGVEPKHAMDNDDLGAGQRLQRCRSGRGIYGATIPSTNRSWTLSGRATIFTRADHETICVPNVQQSIDSYSRMVS